MSALGLKRKSGLGRYRAGRTEWRAAYRLARLLIGGGAKPNAILQGVEWKAQLIVAHDRSDIVDPLMLPVSVRLDAQRMINEIIAEESTGAALV